MKYKRPGWINSFYAAALLGLAIVVLFAINDSLIIHPLQNHHAIPDLSINLGAGPVREHCTYCHTEGSRPSADLSQRAVTEHPDISPHQWEKLGCTGCHLGEGMALDVNISHGLPGLGARSVLKGKDLQASCFQCHLLGPLPGAEKAWKGYQAFLAKGCNTCHHVAGLGRGGRYGPDLSLIGSLLGLDLIQQAIRDPKENLANSIMPRFPLSAGQAREIAYFLKSRVKQPFYATPMQIQSGQIVLPALSLAPPGQELAAGEKLLYEKQCLACHQFREVNGRIAPDLSFIGSQRDREYLSGFLDNPARYIPGAMMPQIPMSTTEQNTLIDYLASQALVPKDLSQMLAHKMGHEEPAKQLFMRLCQACHAAEGNGLGPVQPNLANFPRPFAGNAQFFRRADQQRLLTSIEKGIAGTSMPGYGHILTKDQREQVLELVFQAFIGIKTTDKETLSALPEPSESLPLATIDALFLERCSRCHGVSGNGKGEESLNHLPRPRNLTNSRYFTTLSDERIASAIHAGIPGTAMPAHAELLSANELWGLVEKVRRLSRVKNDE